MSSTRGRLGIYIDDVYWIVEGPSGRRASTDRSFVLFLCELGSHFDGLTLFGRAVQAQEPADYVLRSDVELVELPHYPSLGDAGAVARSVGGTVRAFWRGLDGVDTLWIFGPHPFALLLVALAAVRRRRVVLGVRQDSVRVYAARLSGRRRLPVLLGVRAMAAVYRFLGRWFPTTVQGAELAAKYGGRSRRVLPMTESITRSSQILEAASPRDWSGEIQLLTVGRLEPEKNPALLVDALAELERGRPGRFRLTWVGRGPEEDDTRRRAAQRGVADLIDFVGYVPYDGGLLDLYRDSHVFVHVSFSEGMPKVIIEALTRGVPIVATDVGGVRAALDDGRTGLLVPPDDLGALVAAVLRIVEDPASAEARAADGLELARSLTLEAQVARVLAFVTDEDAAPHVAGGELPSTPPA